MIYGWHENQLVTEFVMASLAKYLYSSEGDRFYLRENGGCMPIPRSEVAPEFICTLFIEGILK